MEFKFIGVADNGTFIWHLPKCPYCWASFFQPQEVVHHLESSHNYANTTALKWTLIDVRDIRYPGKVFYFVKEGTPGVGL